MKRKDIIQTIEIKAKPHEVYDALMNSRKHAKFSGGKASISTEVGGQFTVYDGYIEGINLELVPDKKIVQHWRGSDWPAGYYSRVSYELNKTKTGTQLMFTQIGVPEQFYEDVKKGWEDFYWSPMKEMLEK